MFRPFDARLSSTFDLLAPHALHGALQGCQGIIHLAAVSRVRQAELDRAACHRVNVEGTAALVSAALSLPHRPWLLFISSREVYGSVGDSPVTEDHPLAALNVYGGSKIEGEAIVEAGRRAGLRTGILRLTNVYGSVGDYPDRVVPAFTCAALAGAPLRLEGATQRLDLLHMDDAVAGIVAAAQVLRDGERLPNPIHLTTGVPVTLGDLALSIRAFTRSKSALIEAPPRGGHPVHFVGDPSRAAALLGWRPIHSLDTGLRSFIHAQTAALPTHEATSCEF